MLPPMPLLRTVSVFLAPLLSGHLLLAVQKDKSGAPQSTDLIHVREELGVNQFTAPSIALLLDELAALHPVPPEKFWRDLPESTPQDRPRLALSAGQVIADGLLAVEGKKRSRLESTGRLLLKFAKGLGVADHLSRHSKTIIELAARERWTEMREELVRAQAEVEAGMMSLKDEELAHLVSLGGWLRGLEMAAQSAVEGTPDRAKTLVQPELYDYFINRLETLRPPLKKSPLMVLIAGNLDQIRTLASKNKESGPGPAEIRQIRDLVRATNRAVAGSEP
ncbi:MAG: hypothetical protein RLZZ253_1239 [Verrucomicrobiota bacterium]